MKAVYVDFWVVAVCKDHSGQKVAAAVVYPSPPPCWINYYCQCTLTIVHLETPIGDVYHVMEIRREEGVAPWVETFLDMLR
jgi:hypothetical protein